MFREKRIFSRFDCRNFRFAFRLQNSTSAAPEEEPSLAFAPIFPSEDGLSAPKYFLDGRCVPKKIVLEKGETATWEFKRSTGSVFEELVSPFIWTMPDGTIQKGNGLSSVNVVFDKVGKYTPSLNVDGNDVSCEQV